MGSIPVLPPQDSMQLGIIIAIAIAVAAVAFALQNNVPVTVTFLVWRFDSSLAMVLLLALAIGAVVMALVTAPGAVRARWTMSRQRKELSELRAATSRPAPAEPSAPAPKIETPL
jgi:lipopolysaccharide assembly protein A